jgi:hypothetical protein
VSNITLRRNGQSVPFDTLKLDFANNQFLPRYFTQLHGTGIWGDDQAITINAQDDYKNEYALYVFNLLPDYSNGTNFNLVREGNISLDIRLKEPADTSITIVVYMEYDAIMEIHSNRNITFNE